MLNKVILIGRASKDPEINSTKDGKKIANLSLATNDYYKDKDGNRQEKTEWHRVVIFGGLADIADKYVKKGDKVYIEGSIQTRKYTDNSGKERQITEIVVGMSGKLLLLSDKPKDRVKDIPVENDVDESGQIPF